MENKFCPNCKTMLTKKDYIKKNVKSFGFLSGNGRDEIKYEVEDEILKQDYCKNCNWHDTNINNLEK